MDNSTKPIIVNIRLVKKENKNKRKLEDEEMKNEEIMNDGQINIPPVKKKKRDY